MGWLIGIVLAALAVAHKSATSGGASTSGGTVVTVGTPSFGIRTVNESAISANKEPVLSTWQEWQKGGYVPVPTGSRADYLVDGTAASDAAINQHIQLQQYGGPTVINPDRNPNDPTLPVSAAGGSGGGAPVVGAPAPSGGGTSGSAPTGGTSFGGGGGLAGGGRRISLF